MKFTPYKLGEFCRMKYGKMPPKEILSEEGFPVFSGYRITGYAKEYLFDEPRVIIVARGVGGTGDVKMSPEKSWITNLAIVLDHDPKVVDKKFLLYRLGIEPLKDKLNTGAAQAQITIDSLTPYVLPLPELEVQSRIAFILSAYDDLIENNRRRIQLLEQAARLLYKEWFVHLRFPGHEHTKIQNGIPEGWKAGTIGDLGEVITGKTPSKKEPENYGNDLPFIKTPDMHGNAIVVHTEESLSEEGAKTQANKTLPPRSILISCIGTVGAVAFNASPAQTNQQINSIVPASDSVTYWAYFMAKDLRPLLEGMGGGATMANVNKSKFSGIKIVIPSRQLLELYFDFAKPVFDQIENLTISNARLAKSRDLLLPRLMNGELIF
ncbi:MAG: restriction endonuclease subunit S [Nitrospiraceae bacterium]|nr:restriction endonuclease subunit S [Nitrospira sp.]MCB9774297.1 restriction endonuclease subunit S [Nitrospiraceae bacterium]